MSIIGGFNFQFFSDNQHQPRSPRIMTAGYDDCYDASWHLIPPDYVTNDDDYR